MSADCLSGRAEVVWDLDGQWWGLCHSILPTPSRTPARLKMRDCD